MSASLCIEVGDVLYLHCTHCVDRRFKYYVVAQVEPVRMFLINSELTDFQAGNPAIVACNPIIRAHQHQFLKYDSYIGCDHLSHEYNYATVEGEIARNPSCKVGHLHDDAKAAIADALKGNDYIRAKYLRELKQIWLPDP